MLHNKSKTVMFIQLDKVDHAYIAPQWVSCNLDPNEGTYMGHSQCKIDIANAQTYVTTNQTLVWLLLLVDITEILCTLDNNINFITLRRTNAVIII